MKILKICILLLFVYPNLIAQIGGIENEVRVGKKVFISIASANGEIITVQNKTNINLENGFLYTTVFDADFDQDKLISTVIQTFGRKRIEELQEIAENTYFKLWMYLDDKGRIMSVVFVLDESGPIRIEELSQLEESLKERIVFENFKENPNVTPEFYGLTLSVRFSWILTGRHWKE